MKATVKAARITPKKANLIAGMVRTKPVNESLEILKFTPKKAANILHKVLLSAVSNAVSNFKQEEATLSVKEIIVTKGPTLKRGVPVSRGRMHPILKRTSNITITLEVQELATTKKTPKKTTTESEKSPSTSPTPAKKTTATRKTTKKS